ncbi:MAG: choice-of-anchor tandem repeat NxxGxxAF-containing protein, partial [Pirellulales bacterium]
QGVTDIIAMSGTPAPGNGMLDVLYLPVLNNAGQAAFAADLSGTNFGTADDRAIYRSQGGPLVQIARDFSSLGALVIADTSYATNLSGVAMNDAGQVVYRAGRAPIFGSLDDVIERSDGTNVATIARTGQSAPDGNGTFSSFYTTNLNASGEVAFLSSLTGTSEDQGRFRGSGGPVTQIARIGQSAPDGNGTFSSFGYSHLNASGQTAFDAYLAGTGGTGNSGVFRGAGGSITQIARAGQPAPDGNGVFSLVQMRGLDASGQVAFHAQLAGTRGGSSDDRGIYRGSGAAISQIARGAQPAPDGNGVFDFFSTTAFNTSGQAAFLGFLTHTRGGVGDNEGIFGSIDGAIRQFARKGQPAPDGNGTFFGFRLFDFNAAGQAGFSAALAGTSDGNTNNAGLFLANGIDVIEVARTGEGLANSTIAALFVSETSSATSGAD